MSAPFAPTPLDADPAPLYAPLPPGVPRLRVVVLVDRDEMPAWLAEAVAAIAASDACELAGVVVAPLPRPPRFAAALEAYLALDARLGRGVHAAVALRPLAACAPALALRHATASERDGRLVLDEATQVELRGLAPDLLLGFGLPPAAPELAASARHGAWFLERRATDPKRAGLAFLEPLWRGTATTPSGLVVHRSDVDAWQRLAPGRDATAQLSFARNRAYALLRLPATIERLLRRLARGERIDAEPAPAFAPPRTPALARFALRLLARAARRHLPRLGRREDWLIGLRRGATALDPARPRLDGLGVLEVPPGRFWADPFLFRHGGRDYLFVEEYPYATRRGRIAVAELDAELRVAAAHVLVERPWHLSYPIVFGWRDRIWMTVESSAARRTGVYRALEFPQRWEFVGDLLCGRNAVDATLHCDGERWYLFACISESPLGCDPRVWTDLFVFHAPTPLGPWQPHVHNPVVSDVRRARPAGPLFVRDGRLIRPAQDCSVDYGHAVVFNDVVTLAPEHYEERPLGTLAPDWRPQLRGCHTYAAAGDVEAVDGKRLVPRRAVRADSERSANP
ncbi:MAG TPA: hypothetical protein VGC30_06800 [Dokdonella sp.]